MVIYILYLVGPIGVKKSTRLQVWSVPIHWHILLLVPMKEGYWHPMVIYILFLLVPIEVK
ncbi:MAG: hypothetical protein EBR82_54780 [Caulobacteraceae bacterium]|nr:hypothetical protein [Caulobacteraceae bacterium]